MNWRAILTGRILKIKRLKEGLSYEEMAKQFGVSPELIKSWEELADICISEEDL